MTGCTKARACHSICRRWWSGMLKLRVVIYQMTMLQPVWDVQDRFTVSIENKNKAVHRPHRPHSKPRTSSTVGKEWAVIARVAGWRGWKRMRAALNQTAGVAELPSCRYQHPPSRPRQNALRPWILGISIIYQLLRLPRSPLHAAPAVHGRSCHHAQLPNAVNK
jgi:hypothetical protein